MSKVSDTILKRVYLLFAGFIFFGVLVCVQVLRLQWGKADYYEARKNRERVYKRNMLADRGSILADDGSVLATTLPFFRIAIDATRMDPRYFPNFPDSLNALCTALATQFGEGEADIVHFKRLILHARQEGDRHVYLFPYRRLCTIRELKQIEQMPIFGQGRYRGGLIVEKVNNSRFYPLDNLAKITLGSMRNDTVGSRGIEYSFNRQLRGRDGQMLVQRVGGGVEVPLNYIYEVEAQDGLDIQTTLNVNIQDVTDAALRQAVEKHRAKWGLAIVMEVQTGEIKALANYPESYNHAVATRLEIGSTFKLVSTLALMESSQIQPDDSVDVGKGRIEYADRVLKDDYISGRISLQEAIERSSNVGVSKLVNAHFRHNPEKFYLQLDALGITRPVHFQLKGEPFPKLIRPQDKAYNATTLPWLSIGYNISLTPLQMLTFYNGLANGGVMLQPLIVKEIRSKTQVLKTYEAEVLNPKMCSEQTLSQLQAMLRGVVERGTARSIRKSKVPIAGKTGTAQRLKDGHYTKAYVSSFVGYFPADQPRYSCIVLINEPEGGDYYGGDVAAPVVREVAEALQATRLQPLQAHLAVPAAGARPSLPASRALHRHDAQVQYKHLRIPTEHKPSTDYVRVRTSPQGVSLHAYRLQDKLVPDVKGMPAKDAMALLENLGLRVALRGHGQVYRQSLKAGSRLYRNQLIVLDLK
ncbi:MAG: penicillin-binding protein [Sphingobacteriia bacterium]